MDKIKSTLRQPEFHIFLFCFGLLLFSYPLFLMSNKAGAAEVLLFLFLPWATVILIMFLMSRSYAMPSADENEDQEEGEGIDV